MEGEKRKLIFDSAGTVTIMEIADMVSLDFERFMQTAFNIGFFCANVCLENQANGHETKLYHVFPDDSADEFNVDFSDDKDMESPFPELEEGLFEEGGSVLTLEPSVDELLVDTSKKLGIAPHSFIDMAVSICWNMAMAERNGASVLISSGDSECYAISAHGEKANPENN